MSKKHKPLMPESSEPIDKRGSSVIMRFATSTGLLAVAVVILAIIFFHTIRGDVFQGAFQAPLKEWSATIAGHIGPDISKCFSSKTDSAFEQALVQRVLTELKQRNVDTTQLVSGRKSC